VCVNFVYLCDAVIRYILADVWLCSCASFTG